MIKVGNKVLISANMHGNKQKDEFVGHTGKISKIDMRSRYPYSVEFDDDDMQQKSNDNGRWIWTEEDLTVLEDDNLGYVR